MTPITYFQSLTVSQLRVYACRSGVTIRQNWAKPHLIAALVKATPMVEASPLTMEAAKQAYFQFRNACHQVGDA